MYKICTKLEEWIIDCGSYPKMHIGERKKLSLCLEVVNKYKKVSEYKKPFLKQCKYSEYEFGGKLLSEKEYISLSEDEKLKFRVYLNLKENNLEEGDFVEGIGNFNIELCAILSEYEAVIEKINKVNIPEKFISRSKYGLNGPCALNPEYYSKENVKEIEFISYNTSPGDLTNAEVFFYLLELNIFPDS